MNGQKTTFLENGRHMSLIEFWGIMGSHSCKVFKGKKAKKMVNKKKVVKKKIKCQTKKCPALLILLYFLPLITGPYDLTIASVVSVL